MDDEQRGDSGGGREDKGREGKTEREWDRVRREEERDTAREIDGDKQEDQRGKEKEG